jgi:hypothetical protein
MPSARGPFAGSRDSDIKATGRIDNLIRQANSKGLVGSDLATIQKKSHCPARTDQARQPGKASAAWRRAQMNLGKTDACVRAHDPVVATKRQLSAAAESQADNRGDGRLRKSSQPGKHLVLERQFLLDDCPPIHEGWELFNVGSGRKGSRTGAANDDGPHVHVRFKGRERLLQVARKLSRHEVEVSDSA